MRRGIFIGAAAMLILVLVAAAAGAQTHLSVRHASPDEVVIESSTGDDATLPLASANQAGLMSTKHVEELERARRQVPDDVRTQKKRVREALRRYSIALQPGETDLAESERKERRKA